MTGKTFEIQVQDDHLQQISQVRKPILAVAELIWNAVDADADCIDVVLHDDNLGGFKTIEVADNGHGTIGYITPKDILAGHQQEIQAERDRKLDAAREQRKNRRQRAA
jgi:DNA mismatch repair ATPase MutL